MKRTYLPSELPEAKTKEDAIRNILSLASGKGFKIKNPYVDDFLELRRIQYALWVLNDLIKKNDPMLPKKIKRFKTPKLLKELTKELEKKVDNWKI